ncbi:MAG TPA: prolipoprotein diacylglyceryl transferase family protein [Minicystis sp.]|nr:prolipoprotein diacylglyceryl transferase family protein [Minicystis sp.]
MHPILFRVPLPHSPAQWGYLFFALAGIAAAYAAYSFFVAKRKGDAAWGLGFAVAAVVLRFVLRDVTQSVEATSFPIYSYGVMLGASLVCGWFLTLGLAERDGLPRDQMGDCYVDTAIMAVIGSRVLYILTNLNEFPTLESMFAMRNGGLVAYGGFLGGWLGSWLYLRFGVGVLTTLKRLSNGDIKSAWHPLPMLAWADVAVPSLASGLMITRIGCYLFGCDFGKPLSSTAPALLKKLGTFPRWPEGTLEHGSGSPAWAQHVKEQLISRSADASLPVHPTQLYESLVGAGILVLLLWARRKQKFRGEICFLFFFAYGVCRYLLEVVRDDDERGSLPPSLPLHVLVPLGLAVFAIGYGIGFAQEIKSVAVRRVTQVAAFLPAIIGYLVLKPATFGEAPNEEWSTSQWIGMATALAGCIGFNILYRAYRANPARAMALELPPPAPDLADEDDDEDDDDDADEDEAPAAKKKPAPKPAATKAKAKAAPAEPKKATPKRDAKEAEDDDAEDDDEAPEPGDEPKASEG